MKKFMSILLTLALTVGILSGCGGGKDNNNGNTEGKDQVVLQFWTISLASFGEYINGMIDAYEKENPHVKIEWLDAGIDVIQNMLVTSTVSGNAPDVINLNTQFALQLGPDYLVDLNAEATDEQKGIYVESLWKSASIGDSIYAFPWYASPNIMIYNTELFEKAGITETPSTYSDAMKLAKQFKEATGAYLFYPEQIFNMFFMEDIDILNSDQTAAAFNTDETVKLLEEYKKLTDGGYLPKTMWGDWTTTLTAFSSKQLGIINSAATSVGRVKDASPEVYEKIAVANPLTGNTGLSQNPLMNMAVSNLSDNTEEAIKFANFITNDENQLKFTEYATVFPSSTKASQDDFFTSDTKTIEGKANAQAAESSLTSEDFSLGSAHQDAISNELKTMQQAIFQNGEDVKASLDKAEKAINDILASGN